MIPALFLFMRIVVDVMSGDHGPDVVLEGVQLALQEIPSITKLYLVGKEDKIASSIARLGMGDARLHVQHANEVLTMEDDPLEGIRKKKDSSMLQAIELVRHGSADAVISSGNTGALVAASMKLRRLEGVERPVLAVRMPSRTGDFILADAGANTTCEPIHLAQFAIMGSIYARQVLNQKNPRVGVLSNGSEAFKGNALTMGAVKLCEHLDLNFKGNVEGFDLFNDGVDVAVTDGFTGNVVLKTSESLGYTMMHLIRSEVTQNPVRKLGALLLRGAFHNIKRRMDPEIYGGAVLLGLRGNVIKAHGSSRPKAIMGAIRVAVESVKHHVIETIIDEIRKSKAVLKSIPSPETDTQTAIA